MTFKFFEILQKVLILPAILLVCLFGNILAADINPFLVDKSANPDGRWNITFQLPNGRFQTLIEFTAATGNQIDWVVLGPIGTFQLTPTKGKISGNTVNLEAETSWGKLKVKVTLDGDKLQGKWSPSGLIASQFFSGAVHGNRDRSVHPALSNVELFDQVWEQVNDQFYNPQFNGVDWRDARQRYRPKIETARSAGQAVTLIRQMLAELRSSHLEFFAIPGKTPNPSSEVEPATNSATPAASWRRISPSVGYLKINRFEDGAPNLALIDRAFAELSDLPNLVIDVRGNPGGSLGIAMRVGDYIFPKKTPIGYFVTRSGLAARGVQSIDGVDSSKFPVYSDYDLQSFKTELNRTGGISVATGGRAPQQYGGRIVLLIDEKGFSTTEAFAAVIKETSAATLIGRRTAGGMLGADYFPLKGGWMLTIPVRDFRTPKGVLVEGKGVEPDITVKSEKKGDPELARALEFFEKK